MYKRQGRGVPLFASLRGKYLSINLFNLSIGRYRIYAEPYTAKKYFTYSPWNGRKSVVYYLCRRVRVIGRSRVPRTPETEILEGASPLESGGFSANTVIPNDISEKCSKGSPDFLFPNICWICASAKQKHCSGSPTLPSPSSPRKQASTMSAISYAASKRLRDHRQANFADKNKIDKQYPSSKVQYFCFLRKFHLDILSNLCYHINRGSVIASFPLRWRRSSAG
mgnify:CR=1 FL=1